MAKRIQKAQGRQLKDISQPEKASLSLLRQEFDLWHRVHILLYDLQNVAKDPSSERRICSTTHELYISEPYFTEFEANRIRSAIVDSTHDDAAEIDDASENSQADSDKEGPKSALKSDCTPALKEGITVEELIHTKLSNFFEKRKASGDARPCGPHDMLPIYLNVFNVSQENLTNDQFLTRLRKFGLRRDVRPREGERAEEQSLKRG